MVIRSGGEIAKIVERWSDASKTALAMKDASDPAFVELYQDNLHSYPASGDNDSEVRHEAEQGALREIAMRTRSDVLRELVKLNAVDIAIALAMGERDIDRVGYLQRMAEGLARQRQFTSARKVCDKLKDAASAYMATMLTVYELSKSKQDIQAARAFLIAFMRKAHSYDDCIDGARFAAMVWSKEARPQDLQLARHIADKCKKNNIARCEAFIVIARITHQSQDFVEALKSIKDEMNQDALELVDRVIKDIAFQRYMKQFSQTQWEEFVKAIEAMRPVWLATFRKHPDIKIYVL